jgi:pyruvate/2-oxoglutarate dehydrogenase complex dihydrolipoamide acyltransferase (E2) component
MGFACTIKAPDVPGQGVALLQAWLKPAGAWIDRDDPLFVVLRSGAEHVFKSNMPGVLREIHVAAGTVLASGEPIAMAEVDGDEIPYGRPYVVPA